MRRTIPWLAGGAAALTLITVASCTSTPATAEPTPDPVETPTLVTISARAESACGLITVDHIAPDGADVSIFRAEITDGQAPQWVAVPELLTQRTDYPTPHGATYAYRVDADLDRDGEVDESVMSDEVTSHVCVTPSPSVSVSPSVDPTPVPSPSVTPSAEPTGAATATPSPTPTVPVEKDAEGGLAATGA